MILPGSTIGILGGGQLGRYFTLAARELNYKVIVFDPDVNSPAGMIANQHIQAEYTDEGALVAFGEQCEVVTTEFENIPAASLNIVAQQCLVHPPSEAVEIAQDRIAEKAFIKSCGLLPVPYGEIQTASDIAKAIDNIEFPAIIKTSRFGYDGKGQVTVNSLEDVKQAYRELEQVSCVLEQRIDLFAEISVVLGRNQAGETTCFPVSENVHVDGILHQSIVPSYVEPSLQNAAQVAAKRIADKLNYVGVLAVEFFITKKGDLFINEMAPRTHNSGHYTMDACITSQFEQHVRMVCDLPAGDTKLLSPVVMTNILGDLYFESNDNKNNKNESLNTESVVSEPTSKYHDYGKHQARKGRKMGHYNVLSKDVAEAKAIADKIFKALED